ncbi:MAG: hypothetical protein K8R88_05695 [Armatimonadetes bacterium]|nr:hypothetical protein [Armatimonadota bacterium]
MKVVKFLCISALVLGLVGLVGSTIISSSLVNRAKLVQRIAPYDKETAELTGEHGTAIGSPQLMIIDDASVFMTGTGDKGARLVNDKLMQEKGIYPLQAKTVSYIGGLAQAGFGAAVVVGLLGTLWVQKRAK